MRQAKASDLLWKETENFVPSVLKLAEEYRQMNL